MSDFDFVGFMKQLNVFFNSSVVSDALNKTKPGSKRSVVDEVTQVKEAVSLLDQAMGSNQVRISGVVTKEAVMREALLNPFNFVVVEVGDEGIKGRKMKTQEAMGRINL